MSRFLSERMINLILYVCLYFILINRVQVSMINRNTSPSARLQPVEPATVYRSQSPEPPVYYDQK